MILQLSFRLVGV